MRRWRWVIVGVVGLCAVAGVFLVARALRRPAGAEVYAGDWKQVAVITSDGREVSLDDVARSARERGSPIAALLPPPIELHLDASGSGTMTMAVPDMDMSEEALMERMRLAVRPGGASTPPAIAMQTLDGPIRWRTEDGGLVLRDTARETLSGQTDAGGRLLLAYSGGETMIFERQTPGRAPAN